MLVNVRKLKKNKQFLYLGIILLGISILIFLINSQTSLRSRAATNTLEAEAATLAGSVTKQNDAQAAGGSFLQFGSTANPTPTSPVVTPTRTPTPAPGGTTVTIAAAGDIACAPGATGDCKQKETSDILVAQNPTTVLTLGDNQYESGQLANFQQVFHPTWGRVKSKIRPSLGNHDYGTANAAGYFDYFNGAGVADGPAGQRGKGWYSFNLGDWHIIALNSQCAEGSGPSCAVGSEQEQWLRDDLTANQAKRCTLAYWHHPYYTSGTRGPSVAVRPLVQALYEFNADVILVGHMHFYERFSPQDPNYNLDTARGIRSFTVGTGGRDVPRLGNTTFKNMDKRDTHTFGVLKLTLAPTSYSWQFLPIAGQTFTDTGTQTCH